MNEDRIQLARVEQLLEENLQVAEETNSMLRDMRRWSRIGVFFKIILWSAVIILPFLLLKPIIEQLVPASNGVPDSALQERLEQALDLYQGQ